MRLKYGIGLALLILTIFSGARAWAGESPVLVDRAGKERDKTTSIARRFLGERLDYHLGVFWFNRAADCVISFQQDRFSGQYVARMWAKTRGFIGWLTNYRENQYVSYMEEVDGGRRLRPLLFEKKVIVGRQMNQSFHWFDYQQGRIDYAIIRNNEFIYQNCYDIPEGVVYEDILSAFYNMRAGAFGKIKRGRSYLIPAISTRGIDKYTVKVLNKRQEQRLREEQDWEDDTGFVLKIKIDKNIFGTRNDLIWAWISEDFVPVVGVVEDAVGLGDVTGRLNQTGHLSP